MVTVKDLLAKHVIVEVNDVNNSDTTDSTGTGQNKTQSTPTNQVTTTKLTPLTAIAADLINTANLVVSNAKSVITDILSVTTDQNLTAYTKIIDQIVWNPASLLADPKSRPNLQVNVNAVTEIERDIYRRVVDPRASSLLDLNMIIADAGSSQYLLNTLTNNLLTPNGLYSQIDDSDPVTRLNLYREQEHLNNLNQQIFSIRDNTFSRVTDCFLYTFSRNVGAQVTNRQVSVSSLIQQLQTMKTMLQVALISQTSNWEQISGVIRSTYGNMLNSVAQRAITTQASMIASHVDGAISGLLSAITSNPAGNLGLCLAESTEFGKQISGAIFSQLTKSEDHLIAIERADFEIQRSRALIIQNTQKTAHTKQFIQMLTVMIEYLQIVQSNQNFNYSDVQGMMTQSIENMKKSGVTGSAPKLLKNIVVGA